jgi:formate--tetrahydrofolate ligase
VVLVVTVRALRIHGGGDPSTAKSVRAIERGLQHLDHHVQSVRMFGFESVIAINCFADDTELELNTIEAGCRERGLKTARFTGFSDGGAGADALAQIVIDAAARPAPPVRYLYDLAESPEEKIASVASKIYGAHGVEYSRTARSDLERIRKLGCAQLPVCIAKSHLSLIDDAIKPGKSQDLVLAVEAVRIAAGAGYLLALAGDIVTMPGLPSKPAACRIDLSNDGEVIGL